MNAMRLTWRDRSTVALATVGITAGLVAVNVANPKPAAAEPALKPFDSCTSVASWYRTKITDDMERLKVNDPASVLGGRARLEAQVGGQTMPAAAATDLRASSSASETGTNVQEAGVDEADTAKVVNGRLITLNGSKLVIVDVTGSAPVELGSVVLAPTTPDEELPGALQGAQLQVDGNRVLITWSTYRGAVASTQLAVVDISAPSTPRITAQLEVQGQQLTSRLVDGRVRLALSSMPELGFKIVNPSYEESRNWSQQDWDDALEETAAKNREILRTAAGEDFLPKIITRDAAGKQVSTRPLIGCEAIYHPKQNAGANTLSLLTLDLKRANSVVDVTGLTADGDLVYASQSRFYIATTRGGWVWMDQPFTRTSGAIAQPSDRTTELHAFEITSPDSARYTASGDVHGWLLGQWAMSEQDGLLRVAATRDNRPQAAPSQPADVSEPAAPDARVATVPEVRDPSTDAAVTVFREEGGALSPIGSVGGLGKGEQIRAVRWFGDTAVVVTFRQTDPLYLIDLADPKKPTVSGELKVNGYSAYLHPVGDDQLLGIGQDADDQGRTKGTQVATFDVSNPSSPSRIDVRTEPNTQSNVEFDSKAFNFLADQKLALVPVSNAKGHFELIGYTINADGSLTRTDSWRSSRGNDYYANPTKVVIAGENSVVAIETGSHNTLTLTTLAVDGLTPTGSLKVS